MTPALRHFGPPDPVPLAYLRQAGATDVVTALHHLPVGDAWPVAEIQKRQAECRAAGLEWSVVESLPVSEAIKTRTGPYAEHLANYRTSLENLAECGIRTVTYNFMPVVDWTRTDLDYRLPDGGSAIRFDRVDLAVYDIHVLERPGAEADYPDEILALARERFAAATPEELARTERNVIRGLPGSEESFTRDEFRAALEPYADIDAARLRAHLIAFLEAVVPTAAALGLRLVVHPDDPPFPILGLPRVVSTAADLDAVFAAVPAPANGLCFCTGSFGARPDNDLPAMVDRFADRIGFAHLRSVQRESNGSFHEAHHLGGDAGMPAVVAALLRAQTQHGPLVFRPDHGHRILDDLQRPPEGSPGYTAIGRLKGLAELRGLMLGLSYGRSN